MKKLVLICSVLFASVTIASAQAPLGKGNAQFNAGFGFSSWGVPIYAGADFGVHPDITIGPQVSYRHYNEKYRFNGNRYNYGYSIFGIAFNGNYHFNKLLEIPDEWDFYAGLTLGYYIWSTPSDYIGTHDSGIGLDGQIGGRYFWNDSWAVNLELGGGSFSGGKIGVTYIFK